MVETGSRQQKVLAFRLKTQNSFGYLLFGLTKIKSEAVT